MYLVVGDGNYLFIYVATKVQLYGNLNSLQYCTCSCFKLVGCTKKKRTALRFLTEQKNVVNEVRVVLNPTQSSRTKEMQNKHNNCQLGYNK